MVKKEKLLKTPKHLCPSCNSANYKVVGQHSVDIGGLLGDQAYQTILYKRVVCQSCRQHSMVKDYVAEDSGTEDQN